MRYKMAFIFNSGANASFEGQVPSEKQELIRIINLVNDGRRAYFKDKNDNTVTIDGEQVDFASLEFEE